jgi:hypothetical protein
MMAVGGSHLRRASIAPATPASRGTVEPGMARRTPLLLWLVLSLGCAASPRGPVDRSVDAVHETNRTVGESAEVVTSGSPRSVVVDAVTLPFRLVARLADALFG